MRLKVNKENEKGLNTEFINIDTNRIVTLEHAIKQIKQGNKKYDDYQVVTTKVGTEYIRSKPDGSKKNNIE